jgi:hypothetical protein
MPVAYAGQRLRQPREGSLHNSNFTHLLRPSRVVENYHLEERANGKKVLKWASQKGTVTN